MIASLRGKLAETYSDHVVIDVNGVGYRVFVSQSTLAALPPIGQEVHMRIHTHLREDALLLFGFHSTAEKEAFNLLTAVTGVGPKLALAVLSAHSPEMLSRAVYNQDIKALTRVSGVGKKTAERILLELRDRMKLPGGDTSISAPSTPTTGGVVSDAIEALVSLGYGRSEAEQAIGQAQATLGEPGLETGTLLRAALQRMNTIAK